MNSRLLLPLLMVAIAGFGCSPAPSEPQTSPLKAQSSPQVLYSASLVGGLEKQALMLDFVRTYDTIRGSFDVGGTSGHIYGTVTSTDALHLVLYKTVQEEVAFIDGDWQGKSFIGTYTPTNGTATSIRFEPRKEKTAVDFDVIGTRAEDKHEDGSVMCTFSFAYPVLKDNDAANRNIRIAFGLLSGPAQGDGEPSIDAAPEGLEKSFLETCRHDIEDLVSDTSTAEFGRQLAYDSQTSFSVELNRGGLFSVLVDTYVYEGGAHGMPAISGLTLDVASGKKLSLGDIVKRDGLKSLLQKARGQVLKEYSDTLFEESRTEFQTFVADKRPATETELVTFSGLENFYLTPNSIVFYWNVYEISPYVAGQLIAEIPFVEIQDIVRKDSSALTSLTK